MRKILFFNLTNYAQNIKFKQIKYMNYFNWIKFKGLYMHVNIIICIILFYIDHLNVHLNSFFFLKFSYFFKFYLYFLRNCLLKGVLESPFSNLVPFLLKINLFNVQKSFTPSEQSLLKKKLQFDYSH